MNRKWYNVYLIFKNCSNIKVREGYNNSGHAAHINLYLTDNEADVIRNLYIEHDYHKRSQHITKDHIMHEIYKVLPELFEY